MPSVQLISQKPKLKKEFKDKFKNKLNVFTSGSLKDGLKNIQKTNIDLIIVDILPLHLKSSSWIKSIVRHKNPSSGELALILIIDPEIVDTSWIQSIEKQVSNCQIFWYKPELFSSSALFYQALEYSVKTGLESIYSARAASTSKHKLDIYKPVIESTIPRKKNPREIFSQPVSFLEETNSNQEFLADMHNALKTQNTVMLRSQEGLESNKIARTMHYLNFSTNSYRYLDLSTVPGYFHNSILFGSPQKNLPGFKYVDNGILESSKKGVLAIRNIHLLKWEVQNELLLALKNNFYYKDDQKITLKTKFIFINTVNLEKYVEKGIFRQDLYSYISGNIIVVPNLQQRKKDIPLIFNDYHQWFQNRYNKKIEVSAEVKNIIFNKNYNGQVEQFYSYLFSIFTLSGNILNQETLKFTDESINRYNRTHILTEPSFNVNKKLFQRETAESDPTLFLFQNQSDPVNIEYSLLDLEREYIKYILNKNFNNIAESARILGITRKTLYDKVKKYKIPVSVKSTG